MRSFAAAVGIGMSFATLAAQELPKLVIERELVLRGGASRSLAWSNDAKWIASGGECGDVLLLDQQTGAVRYELTASGGRDALPCFAPDDRQLAVLTRVHGGHALTMWDLGTGRMLRERRVEDPNALMHTRPAIAWSRDGASIAVVDSYSHVVLLRPTDLSVAHTLDLPGGRDVHAIAFGPDSTKVVVASGDRDAFVFDTTTGTLLEQRPQRGGTRSLAWLTDDRLLQLAGHGTVLGRRDEPDEVADYLHAIAADPNGRTCVAWGTAAVHGFTADDDEPFRVEGNGPCAVHPAGETWAQPRNGTLEIRRGPTLQRKLALRHRRWPESAAFSGDGRVAAIADHDEALAVFRVDDGTPMPLPEGLRGTPIPLHAGTDLAVWQKPRQLDAVGRLSFWSFDPAATRAPGLTSEASLRVKAWFTNAEAPRIGRDGRFAATSREVRDLRAGAPTPWQLPANSGGEVIPAPDVALALTRDVPRFIDGQDALFYRGDDWVRLFDRKGSVLRTWTGFPGTRAVEWAPDGKRFAALATAGLRLFDVSIEREPTLVSRSVRAFAWIDDTHLLVADETPSLSIHRIGEPREAGHLRLPGLANLVTVSSDGRRAIALLYDRALLVRIDR